MRDTCQMQIRGLQVLRAIAACAVVYSHAHSRAVRGWHSESLISPNFVLVGHAGVDLFFVLSGFLMTYLHADAFGRGIAADFLQRRLIRIVPIYWLLTTAGLALLVIAPKLFTYHEGFEWPWAIGAYLFVPWPHSSGVSAPVIGVGWTLNYEMYFYLAFACALMFRNGLSMLAAFFCASVVAGLMLEPAHPWLKVLTGPLLVEFLLGMAVALRVRQLQAPRWVSWSSIILGTTVILLAGYAEQLRVVYWGIPAAMIVAGVVWLAPRCDGRIGRALVLVGDASYSVYLFQVFALPGLALVLKWLPQFFPADIAIGILWLCACAAGVLCWRLVERPLTRAIRRKADSRRLPAQRLEATER